MSETAVVTRIGRLDEGAPSVIGLTGKMGSGKDTVLERLQALFGEQHYIRASFADPLKHSVARLFNVEVEMIEAWKNEPSIRVSVLDLRGAGRDLGRSFSVRELLQRYGTEAHRQVFGDDFWVRAAMGRVAQSKIANPRAVHVFTDVRFENEARAIRELGGRIYEVKGPHVDTGDHASEAGIPGELIEWTIDNTVRPTYEQMTGESDIAARALNDSIAHLDDEVAKLHAELLESVR